MAIAELAGNRIVLETEFRDKELVKQVPGVRWDNDARIWHAPVSWATCQVIRGIFGDELQIGPALWAWAAAEHANRIAPVLALRGLTDTGGHPALRPYQRVGTAFLRTVRCGLLGDDMGTGKTVMALEALRELHFLAAQLAFNHPPETWEPYDPFPALVVCPNSVKRGWLREAGVWLPEAAVEVVTGNVKQRRATLERVAAGEVQVAVINWENLRGHSRLAPYGSTRLRACEVCDPANSADQRQASCERCERELNKIKWATVIADEAHRAKDPTTKQTRALWAVGHQAQVRFRWALTGTPIGDAMDDLWSLMHFVAPDEYPAKTKYIERYAMMSWNAFGGLEVIGIRPETRDEFYRVFDARFLRRPKAAVLPDLPEKTMVAHEVELPAKQRKLYDQLRDEYLAELDSGHTILAVNPLASTTRLIQAAASYLAAETCEPCAGTGQSPLAQAAAASGMAPLGEDPHGGRCPKCAGRGLNYVPTEPSCKLDALDELLEATAEPLVVFAVSRRLIELAATRLDKQRGEHKPVPHVLITGKVPEAARHDNLAKFQRGEARVVLATIDAAGTGFDGLQQAASTVVFLQRSYSRLANQQAEDRIHRIGQEADKVTVIDVQAVDTIESAKEILLAIKSDRFEELVRDADTMRRLLGGG